MESPTRTQTRLDFEGSRQVNVSLKRAAYRGWPDCFFIGNGLVEAIVVPAIGRVMQFRVVGEPDGPFWENRELDGQSSEPDSNEWINFGGDKCWPAPQSDWERQQGRDWPPPAAFDSLPLAAVAIKHGITLTSPVDPAFGIEVVRRVELDPELPVMRIRSEFRKIVGAPMTVSVWTITQLQAPERVFLPLLKSSTMPGGLIRLIEAEPRNMRIEDGLLSLERHPRERAKIGTDAASMAWVGADLVLRIDAENGPGEYPDGGCLTQVYTSPDPEPYIELETLSPLATLTVSDQIERTTTYTLTRRSESDAEAEARRIFYS